MAKEIFADGMSSIHWTGPLIRLDLATMQPQTKDSEGKAAAEVNTRIIMPLDGFLKAFELQQNIIRQLTESGVITVNKPAEEVPNPQTEN